MKRILFVILLLGVLLCVLGESSEGFNPHAAYIIMHAKKKYSKRHLIEATEKALYDKNTRLYIPKRMIVGDSVYNNDMMKTLTARLSFLRVTIGTFGRYVLAEDPSPHLPGYSVGVVINIFWTIDKSLVVSKLEKYMGIGDQCLDDKAKTALHDIFRGFDRMLPLKLKYKDRLMFVHDVKTNTTNYNMTCRIHLKTHHGKYLCAENNHTVIANRDNAAEWETWTLHHMGDNRVALQSYHGKYLCAETNHTVIANRDRPAEWETWHLHVVEPGRVQLRSHHGKYLCAENNHSVIANRDRPAEWETFQVELAKGPVHVRSHHGRYLCAENNHRVVADRDRAAEWETWHVHHQGKHVQMRSHHGRYLCAENNHHVVADRDRAAEWETWHPLFMGMHHNGAHFAFKTHHGKYLCAEDNHRVIANRDSAGPWETWVVHN